MIEDFLRENGIEYTRDESLARHTSFKVGGRAAFMAFPDTEEKLVRLVKELRKPDSGAKRYILGNGTNVIFSDGGFDGVVIRTTKMNRMRVEGNTLTTQAGASLSGVCMLAAANSLKGIEFCYGIPGSIGGGVFMNAGAYGGEISDHIESVTFLDPEGNRRTYSKEECAFGYRDSAFRYMDRVILEARFSLEQSDRQRLFAFMDDIMQRRRDKQPLDMPSAGSSFKRPDGYFAAALIDQCGLKGFGIGGARVSTKHAGFIVNTGGATCRDITALADEISRIVYEQKGVRLEKEMIIVD